MPLDSVIVSALAQELDSLLAGGKIDKVQQPERDTILLSIRSHADNKKLVLCGGVGNARVHLTKMNYENPSHPPMFCMLLRKHISGARIVNIKQPDHERIIFITLEAYDEMGFPVQKTIVIEMIGRGTNIILIDEDNHIIDCLRRVDNEMSSSRQILPGLIYRLPPRQNKPDFFSLKKEDRIAVWSSYNGNIPPEKWLLDTFSSLSPLICRELVYQCRNNISNLPIVMDDVEELVGSGKFLPNMLLEDGTPKDFSFIPIYQYGNSFSNQYFESVSELLDSFYFRRSQAEEIRRRTSALRKTAKNAYDRVMRKCAIQQEELNRTSEREIKRRWGELIISNLFCAPAIGADKMVVEDFFSEGAPLITIPLNPLKSAQQNAATYFKEYTKAKTAEEHLTCLLKENRCEADYLLSVLDEIERVGCTSDIVEIRRELTEAGYIHSQNTIKKERIRETSPLIYISSTGYEILVGRNNLQNDKLTTKLARKDDIWLHTKTVHGSHVLIRCMGEKVDSQTIYEAAVLAAYHSQAKVGGKTAIDYTLAKNVKKPASSLPGMVLYTNFNTLIVEADELLVHKLKK